MKKSVALFLLIAAFAAGVLTRPALSRLYRTAWPPTPGEPAPRAIHRHAAFLRLLEAGPRDVPVLLFGDSITEGWSHSPDLRDVAFGPGTVNLGVGEDRVEHVRWRVANGELDPGRVRPGVVVICVGVNNLIAGHRPAAVRDAIAALVGDVRVTQPTAKVLLLGLPPAGKLPGDPLRLAVAELNSCLAEVPGVRFADAGGTLIEADGRIDPAVMPDFLHPSPEGYRRWASALAPHVKSLSR